jgi:thiamine-monophosphate kinase
MRDELAKIEWLRARFELDGPPSAAIVGIGDDAAVFDFGARPTIVTVDAHVEGTHFRPALISFRDLGWRAMTAAVSDVWAMGGAPSASVVALTLGPDLADASFEELIGGLDEAARATGARVIGGNLSRSSLVSITTTAFGRPIVEPVTRHGARPGDGVYVTGTLGTSSLGLAILEAEAQGLDGAEPFVARWRRPPNNGGAARALARVASAAIDVSDGLIQDLRHLCRASGVGATIRVDLLPLAPNHASLCEMLNLDPLTFALSGGEDYELLFTAAPSAEAGALGTKIGEIGEGSGVRAVDESGKFIAIQRAGYDHFS